MAKKYFVVGANIDSEERNKEDLPGAKNSALQWDKFLREQKFEGECLTDKLANGNDILTKLTELFAVLNDDDFAVFIYVGHGTRRKNKNYNSEQPDEIDGYDELLYCNGNSITDNQIREVLNLNKKKAPVFMVIDACHSGVVENNYVLLNHLEDYNEIVFSATSQDLESYYVAVFDQEKKKAIFSTCLLQVLNEGLDKNYNETFDETVDKLKAYNNPQIPQLAFTNSQILKNKIFHSPLDVALKFSEAELAQILKDTNKGKTGIMKELENLKTENTKISDFQNSKLSKNNLLQKIKILIQKIK